MIEIRTMKPLLQLCIALSLVVPLVSCGGGGVAGTYKLDKAALQDEMVKMAKAKIPESARSMMPEEMLKGLLDKAKAQVEKMTVTVELTSDGKATFKAVMGEKTEEATGTYKIDGDKITMTTVDADSKKEESVTGTLKGGVMRIRPPKSPFEVVLKKD